ncbi:hypothetical protein BDV27DRAFT_108842 [Aspergillus caelatus]|uniref:Uncharacterized protein n=1 Tax=Aspergillus caelatus TaxID=61420 RepID=A0A5N7A8T0_9EURO|nr:uncharacterized protein BDV27DRAFT_108842 [Aspergillus caelatus]KAE8364980.1 hypothetical protein BDV27DRAFT_108842 [Aspergillus caelatus]
MLRRALRRHDFISQSFYRHSVCDMQAAQYVLCFFFLSSFFFLLLYNITTGGGKSDSSTDNRKVFGEALRLFHFDIFLFFSSTFKLFEYYIPQQNGSM